MGRSWAPRPTGQAVPMFVRSIPAGSDCPNVGYSYSLNTSTLSVGSHTIMVTATDSDGTPDAGSSSVTVNVQAPLPAVYIDAPAQGSAVSGTVTVSGWAVDNAAAVGTAISSVQVTVDGSVVGDRDLRVKPSRCLCGLSWQARLSQRGLFLFAGHVYIERGVSHHHGDGDRQRRHSRLWLFQCHGDYDESEHHEPVANRRTGGEAQ